MEWLKADGKNYTCDSVDVLKGTGVYVCALRIQCSRKNIKQTVYNQISQSSKNFLKNYVISESQSPQEQAN